MLKFMSEQDLARLPETDPAYPIVKKLIKSLITDTLDSEFPYDPESDGYIVLMEPDDINRPLTEIWPDALDTYLTDLFWEGFTIQGDYYIGIYLLNNQYGLIFLINQSHASGELRECILRNLDPPEEIQRQQSMFHEETT